MISLAIAVVALFVALLIGEMLPSLGFPVSRSRLANPGADAPGGWVAGEATPSSALLDEVVADDELS